MVSFRIHFVRAALAHDVLYPVLLSAPLQTARENDGHPGLRRRVGA
jgi:hypothetical protein